MLCFNLAISNPALSIIPCIIQSMVEYSLPIWSVTRAANSGASLLRCFRYEFLEEFFLVTGIKGVDHIPQAEFPALLEHIEYTLQCNLFPEVREMVQCNLSHHSVQRGALVLVGKKSARQELDIVYSS